MDELKVIHGSDLKYKIEIESESFDTSTDSVTCEISAGDVSFVIPQPNESSHGNDAAMIYDDEDSKVIYVCFNTSRLPLCTPVYLTVKVHIADDDFPDGYRTEISKVKLCTLYE